MVRYAIQHIYRNVKRGTLPRRVDLGATRVAWVRSEVVDWGTARMKERDAVVS